MATRWAVAGPGRRAGSGRRSPRRCPPPHPAPRPGAAPAAVRAGPGRAAMQQERSVRFLQEQHAEMLAQLHQEIDSLKRENKDLHYKLIMNQTLQKDDVLTPTLSSDKPYSGCSSAAATVASRYSLKNRQQVEQPKQQEPSTEEQVLKVVQTEPDLPDPKVEKTIEQVPSREIREVAEKATSPIPSLASQIRSGHSQVPTSSSNPYLVNVLPSYTRKPPTLEECEIVIRQLWSINHMQAQELMYLKSYLQDILRNKRIPEDYLLASQIGHIHYRSLLLKLVLQPLFK